MEPLPDATPVPEAKARRIIERAIQIDAATAGDTTVGELRHVASELDISPTALMKALDEVEAAEARPAEKPGGRLRRMLSRVARSAAVGLTGIFAGSIVGGPESVTLVVGLMVAGSIGLTLRDRDAQPERSAFFDVLILFPTFLYTWARNPSSSVEFGTALVFATGTLIALFSSIILPRLRGPLTPTEPKQEFTATT